MHIFSFFGRGGGWKKERKQYFFRTGQVRQGSLTVAKRWQRKTVELEIDEIPLCLFFGVFKTNTCCLLQLCFRRRQPWNVFFLNSWERCKPVVNRDPPQFLSSSLAWAALWSNMYDKQKNNYSSQLRYKYGIPTFKHIFPRIKNRFKNCWNRQPRS